MDSAHQIGLETTLTDFLIVVRSGRTGGGVGGILKSEILKCFCRRSNNHQSYGKMEATFGFSASDRSRNHLDRFSNCI